MKSTNRSPEQVSGVQATRRHNAGKTVDNNPSVLRSVWQRSLIAPSYGARVEPTSNAGQYIAVVVTYADRSITAGIKFSAARMSLKGVLGPLQVVPPRNRRVCLDAARRAAAALAVTPPPPGRVPGARAPGVSSSRRSA